MPSMPLYTLDLGLVLVGFGSHCGYSLTAMNCCRRGGSCQAVPLPDCPFEP